MSTIKHPLGRQSSKVYRRRRFVVALGLLAVIVIIALVIFKPGASSGQTGDTDAAKSDAVASSTDTPTTAAAAPPAVDGAPCDPSNVTVEALTDKSSYNPGELPQLTLSLLNNGTTTCVINAGTAAQVFTITSGKDTYWTSTDCQTEPADAEVTLKPGIAVSSSTPIAWDRTRSAVDTCEAATRDAAPAGGASYFLNVTVDSIAAASPKQILLY
ncbi:hypothetical protein GY21_06825 [Cryobacterium roopkundense]|uniref:DUF4232 domain-containing protein n=1 Tax=Cryobacterium roopkundense TaxID=1001240 RepID=A0A099JJI8_9MICO|nr:hypothetical protein [Cryobacterium roopkundense]KGJ78539.1 hypothetical protein GY21_06825 [Cryobacterium roopkundense]MBB5643588.1 hypothetical protein [Cryobacterium roopkundense]